MKPSLVVGLTHRFQFTIPETKTVPHIYPEAAEFQAMPKVLATGFMVALCEWACIDLLKSHLDWPREQTLGTHVDLSHLAPTLPGMVVTVDCTIEEIAGRVLWFRIRAHDGVDTISEGRHQRAVIDAAKFADKLEKKRTVAGV